MGRPSIFNPKDSNERLSVTALTTAGRKLFERQRAWLQKAAKWPGRVSDGDVIEALARGTDATLQYLAKREK